MVQRRLTVFDGSRLGTLGSLFHLILPHDVIQRPNYDTWLNQIIAAYQTQLDSKDRTFSRFLLDIPAVPPDILALVRELCVDPERYETWVSLLDLLTTVDCVGGKLASLH